MGNNCTPQKQTISTAGCFGIDLTCGCCQQPSNLARVDHSNLQEIDADSCFRRQKGLSAVTGAHGNETGMKLKKQISVNPVVTEEEEGATLEEINETGNAMQKCENEIAHLKELHSIRKTAGKPGLFKKDDDRLHHCRIELMELTLRHQLAMQRYKEVATPIRYSFASGSRKMQRDSMEIMRTYAITKCRDAHQ